MAFAFSICEFWEAQNRRCTFVFLFHIYMSYLIVLSGQKLIGSRRNACRETVHCGGAPANDSRRKGSRFRLKKFGEISFLAIFA